MYQSKNFLFLSNDRVFFLFSQNILPPDGILKCPICNETRRLSSIQEVGQLIKNHTLLTLKKTEHHRIAQLGICELCNRKNAYGRCYHCRALACFHCMDEHERIVVNEQTKDYAELIKIRENLNEKISQWDMKLTESKEQIHQIIHNDAEKQIKEIQGFFCFRNFIVKINRFIFRTRKSFIYSIR